MFNQLLEEALELCKDGSMQGLGNVIRPYVNHTSLADLEAYVASLDCNLNQHTGKVLNFSLEIYDLLMLKDKKVLVMLIEDMEEAIYDSMMIEQYNAIIEDTVMELLPIDYFDLDSEVWFSLE